MSVLSAKRLCLSILALLMVQALPRPAQAFKVTKVRHLFDLEHGFLEPSDVAVGKDRLTYVLDGVNRRVVVFDETGKLKFTFGGRGSAPGSFASPLGLATDSQGNVYVADSGNRRVQIFSPQGKVQSVFPVLAKEDEKPADPVDVALDEGRKRLYVVDNDNHHVLVYGLTDFKLLERWGKEGEEKQEFNHPFFITVAHDTSVLVVDVLNTRVQVWSPKGMAVSSIGEYGVDVGQLYRPKGVCVDASNNVFVSDSYIGVIQVFNTYGYLQSVVGDESGAVLKFTTPVGITIDERKRLYVVEMILHRVQVFQIVNTN